jgi:hypothetical protein
MGSGRNSFFLFNNRNRNKRFTDSMLKKRPDVRRYVIPMVYKLYVICDFEMWDFLCEEFVLLQKCYFPVFRPTSTDVVHFCTF